MNGKLRLFLFQFFDLKELRFESQGYNQLATFFHKNNLSIKEQFLQDQIISANGYIYIYIYWFTSKNSIPSYLVWHLFDLKKKNLNLFIWPEPVSNEQVPYYSLFCCSGVPRDFLFTNSLPFCSVGQIDYLYLIQLELLWKQEMWCSVEVL